jgi:pyruvate,water dikinase
MPNIYWFKELSKESLAIAGGKGANLGEMTRAGFPIPEGFVVGSEAYYKFLEKTGLASLIREKTSGLNVEDTQALQAASTAIKDAMVKAGMPSDIRGDIVQAYNKLCGAEIPTPAQEAYVAVRSSATAEDLPSASFAGQQSTFLNMKGADNVVNAVKNCWASLFEARAIFYRVENKFEHLKVGIAVPVQRMVQSKASGVAFSADPVTNDPNRIVIEAGFGLGEAIVSGLITPDRYSIDKRTGKIISKEINRQEVQITRIGEKTKQIEIELDLQEDQKLADEHIIALGKIVKQIEDHYNFPQDIEWALEDGRMYIVQSRAITTLKKAAKEGRPVMVQTPGQAPEDAKVILEGLGASPGLAVGIVKLVADVKELYRVKDGDIMVTRMTSPDYVPAMKRAKAIVTDEGGATCHAAIVSRELGIPCVVGTREATKVLKDGQEISVDAIRGMVYEGSVAFEAAPKAAEERIAAAVVTAAPVATGTKIYVNLAEPELADKVAKQNVDGVGLFRAEFLIAALGKHPNALIKEGKEEEFIDAVAKGLRKVCAAFYPRPVVYRANDFKTNEYRNLEGGAEFEPKEENPMIGYRGCFRYVKDPAIFKLELKAIKRVREKYGMKNLWLMIPFVRRVGELLHAKQLMHEEGMYRTKDFKLWIMVEVPSTVFIIDKFIDAGIDGVSIGSNDLTQLILGADRDNPIVAEEFDERNEAVQVALKRVIERCNERGVTCSLCGQAPSVYPEFAERLVEYGITSMSVNPDVIDVTRRIVASAEQKLLLKKAREKS